jgi:hypothetical protein
VTEEAVFALEATGPEVRSMADLVGLLSAQARATKLLHTKQEIAPSTARPGCVDFVFVGADAAASSGDAQPLNVVSRGFACPHPTLADQMVRAEFYERAPAAQFSSDLPDVVATMFASLTFQSASGATVTPRPLPAQ